MRLLVGVCVLLGCGGKDGTLPDAPTTVDADVDAAPTTVTLSIFEGVAPRVGVRVLFQNADSSVVSDTTTGNDGKATAMMAAGGYVTAIDPFARAGDIRTFAGVKPGDELKLFERPLDEAPINVNFVLPVDANASEYRVSTNCLFQSPISPPTSTIQMAGCGPTSNVLVETFDSLSAPSSSIYQASVALSDNATIDLTGESYTAIPGVKFSYSNLPNSIGSVAIVGARVTPLGVIRDFSASANVAANAAAATIKIPATSGAMQANVSTFYGSGSTQHVVAEWGMPGNYAIDASGLLLPEFTSKPTLDLASQTIAWTHGVGATPQFSIVHGNFNRQGNLFWRWEIVSPTGTRAVLPVLPDLPYNAVAGDSMFFFVRIGSVPGGYDAIRGNALAAETVQDFITSGKAVLAIYVEPEA